MNCEEATALVEKKRDAKLSRTERIGLWIHLLYCKLCGLFFEQSQMVDKTAKTYADKVDSGQKVYPLRPQRKTQLAAEMEAELRK
jgi:hypothetical protein